jgi:hypothetical protein
MRKGGGGGINIMLQAQQENHKDQAEDEQNYVNKKRRHRFFPTADAREGPDSVSREIIECSKTLDLRADF